MEEVSVWSLLARLVFSLGVVIGVMVVAARFMRKRNMGGSLPARRQMARVEVLGRQALGRNTSVTIVRTGGKALVLGVTDSRISVLAEADPEAFVRENEEAERTRPPGGATRPGPTWSELLDRLRDLTARRS